MRLAIKLLVIFLVLLLTACESNPPAPVIDRTPDNRPKPASKTVAKPAVIGAAGKDWRPDSHIVKKGDTLFGIGLEYGVDYKEIAAANNIAPPYPIKIGQKLDLSSFKAKSTAAEGMKTEDGVVLTPIKTEPPIVGEKSETIKPTVSAITPILNEPKAMREAYSLEALNRVPGKVAAIKPAATTSTNSPTATNPVTTNPNTTNPAATNPAPTNTTNQKPADSNVSDDESVTWDWPTQGKVVANFNEATNKGIDIGGATGQAINAASSGKVIYSGSDLRGYGKLVIVKHNKTYLSVYAHNSKIVVKEGQTVRAGQKIAEMGNTDANSIKLHFEIRRLGKSVDPAKYLNQN